MKQRNEIVKKALGNIEQQADTAGGMSNWYDFLQNSLKENGIDAARISGTGGSDAGGVKREDFSIDYQASFHTVGAFLSGCENGKSVCNVREVHLTAPSLTDSILKATTAISFMRKW